MRAAVFLDRDDTLIANRAITAMTRTPGSLFDPGLVQLLPTAAAACRRLKEAGFALVVVTNQGCVARGECGIADVEATNTRMRQVVREVAGVELDGVYYCPYHPKGSVAPYNVEHPWRKPNPGMIRWASDDLRLDLTRSWMIGDAERDIAAAIGAGIAQARTIAVPVEGEYSTAAASAAGWKAATLGAAADVVLSEAIR